MIEMTTDLGPPSTGEPIEVQGDHLASFINSTIGNARPVGFEGGPSLRMYYRVDGVRALARLNLRPLDPSGALWQATLGWGPRGARRHIKFRVIGALVIDPVEYRRQVQRGESVTRSSQEGPARNLAE
jgi:hypothetical protein